MNIIIYLAEKLDKKKRSMLCTMTERSFRMEGSKVSGVRKEGSKVQGSPFRVNVFNRLTAGTFQPLV
jgi:hypothetical protein